MTTTSNAAEILEALQGAGITVITEDAPAGGKRLRLRPSPSGGLLQLVREHKDALLAELADRANPKRPLPSLVFWRLKEWDARCKGKKVILSTMPLREEKFRIPFGSTHWQTGFEDLAENRWHPLSELPNEWTQERK